MRDSQNNIKHPGEHLRTALEAKGWTQDELASILGITRQTVINILTGKTGVTADMAIALAGAFDTSPEYWLKLDSDYRLAMADGNQTSVARRAHLFEFPIRDMQRRGWIKPAKDPDDLEAELLSFFGVTSLDRPPEIPVVMRKSGPQSPLSPRQVAWCFRARQLAGTLPVGGYSEHRIEALKRDLRILAAYPAEASRVPDVMRKYGIRFVVVEHLPGSKIDGAAFWIDEQSPAIAVSLRLDRIDNFWFTLLHECAHLHHQDALSVDVGMGVEEREQPVMRDAAERRADDEAAAALIPPDELQSFIRRIGPIYAKQNVIQFAHRIKIHPGIIVGQLQHCAEIGFSSLRDMLPKIRTHIVSVALTDGWGVELSPGSV